MNLIIAGGLCYDDQYINNNYHRTRVLRTALALRATLSDDSASAGDQVFKLVEEYLERLEYHYGYVGDRSLGDAVQTFSADETRSMKRR